MVFRRTGCGDNIWTVSARDLTFLVKDQTVVVEQKEDNVQPSLQGGVRTCQSTPIHSRQYSFRDILFGHRYPHHYESDKQGILPKGDWPISSTLLQEGSR